MQNKIIIGVLSVLCAFLGFSWLHANQRAEELSHKLSIMEDHAEELEKSIVALKQQLQIAEGKSVDTIIHEANGKAMQTWDTLIDTLQNQLGEFGELIKEELESQLEPEEQAPEKEPQIQPDQKRT